MSSPQGQGPKPGISAIVIVGAIVVLVAIAMGAILLALATDNKDAGLVVGVVASTIGPTIVSFLALLKSDQAVNVGNNALDQANTNFQAVTDITRTINGKLDKVVNQAIANPNSPASPSDRPRI